MFDYSRTLSAKRRAIALRKARRDKSAIAHIAIAAPRIVSFQIGGN